MSNNQQPKQVPKGACFRFPPTVHLVPTPAPARVALAGQQVMELIPVNFAPFMDFDSKPCGEFESHQGRCEKYRHTYPDRAPPHQCGFCTYWEPIQMTREPSPIEQP